MDRRKPRAAVWAVAVLAALLVAAALVMERRSDTGPTRALPPTTTPRPPTTQSAEPVPEVVPDQRLLASGERSIDAGCETPIEVSPPALDLAAVVAESAPGSCFRLAPGTYQFRDVNPKDFMSFLGTSAAEVVVTGDEESENAFHGTATGVTIASMTFSGFQGAGGEKRQEQAPIRGTSAIWASDRGEMATDWLIENIVSIDNYANGIMLGDHFTVRGSRFENNGVTGLSGSEIIGGLIEGNLVTGNGEEQAGGFEVNGGGMKFGETGLPGDPLIVRDNEVFDNVGIGVWCDIGCQGFHVIDNYIHDQSSRGVMFELSQNAVITGNTIIDANSWADFSRDFNAGAITIGESSSVLIEDNFISGAESAVTIRQTGRPVRPQESFLDNYDNVEYHIADVLVRRNVIEQSGAVGISTGRTGIGLIEDPGSIRFEENVYDDPESMSFWWNDGDRMGFDDWQTAGRDTSPSATATADLTPRLAGSSTAASRPEPTTTPIAINAGGGEIVGPDGTQWVQDQHYVGGFVGGGSSGLESTTVDESIYTTERWGLRGYSVPIDNGDYRIELHHAEIFDDCQRVSCRVFSVEVEGETVATDLDIFARVGGRSPLTIATVVTVSDGVLDIFFAPGLQEPQISGLVITPA